MKIPPLTQDQRDMLLYAPWEYLTHGNQQLAVVYALNLGSEVADTEFTNESLRHTLDNNEVLFQFIIAVLKERITDTRPQVEYTFDDPRVKAFKHGMEVRNCTNLRHYYEQKLKLLTDQWCEIMNGAYSG